MSYAEMAQAVTALLEVVARLRSPGGCPWDAEQTPESLKPYLLEECHEVLEALDQGPWQHIREELGDLLLQIALLARIFEEQERFHMGDVAQGITEKLIRRHPHVFANASVDNLEALNRQWDAIKAQEKGPPPQDRSSFFDTIPKTLPALSRARKVTARAARAGFDWPDKEGVIAKIDEEVQELRKAEKTADKKEIEHEFGDVLLSLVNLSRHLDIDAENALQKAVRRFQKRFEYIDTTLKHQGTSPHEANLEEMDALWEKAKNVERGTPQKTEEKC